MRKVLWLFALLCVVGCSSGKKTETAATNSKADEANPNVKATSKVGMTAETKPLIEQASQLIMKREFGKAFEQLNAAIKLDPKCTAAYFMRAGIYADAGQNTRAVADFNQSIALDPRNADFYNARGFFCMTRQQHEQAIKDFSAAIKLSSTHAQACNNRGLTYVSVGKYKEAISDFTETLKLNPQNYEVHNNRGFAYFKAGDSENALADFDAALRINENCLNAYNNKGLVHFKAENYELAAASFTQALERDKLNAKYYRDRRECYLKAGMEAEAKADLVKITWLQELARLNQIALRTKEAGPWIERGKHLIKGEEFEAAVNDFNNALKLDPKSGTAHIGLAELKIQQGKTDEALAECDQAAKLGAESEAASLQGDIYLKLNQLDKAIAAFEEAQRFDTKVAEAYLQRSKERQAKGQTEQANEDFRQAVSLDPSLEGARQ